jgi:VWFA-related protein
MRRLTTVVRGLIAVVVLGCFVAHANGQSATAGATAAGATAQPASTATQSAPATGQVPLLSSNVDEVSVDLVVHDKKHKLVTDLQPGDVAVSDDGTPVKVTGFRLISGDAETGHLVVLMFNSMEGASAKRTEQLADKVLDALGHKGFSFAVLDISGRLRLIQRFTDDRALLSQAIKTVTSDEDRGKAAAAKIAEQQLIAIAHTGIDPAGRHATPAERSQAQILLSALQASQTIAQNQHTRPSLAGLLALSQSLERSTDRKSIIYFAQGPPMDTAATEMVNTVTGAASKAGVSIYTFDMNAYGGGTKYEQDNLTLNGQAPFNPASQPVGGSGGLASIKPVQQESSTAIGVPLANQGPPNWGPQQDLQVMGDFHFQKTDNPFAPKSPLEKLSSGTGGGYIDPDDNLKKILAQMHQDLTTYYQLTYAAPTQDYDGKYRAITVNPLRAGLYIRHKGGYFALPQGDESVVQPFEAPLIKMLSEPQLPSELKFNAAVLQLGELPDGNTNSLVIEAPLSALEMREDARTNLFAARVSMMAQIRDKSGAVVEHFSEDVVRHGALEEMEKSKSQAVTMQRHFYAEPGDYVLETALLDRNSGLKSAQRTNFTIAAAPAGPALSDVVLVRAMDKLAEGADPAEPLKYEDGKVTPNLSGQLSPDDKSVSVFFILHPDAHSAEPAKLEMEVARNGREGKRVPMPLQPGSGAGAAPYLATFKTSALRPGNYEVKALLTQGGKTAEREVAFNIGGDEPAGVAEGVAGSGHGGGPSPADVNFTATGADSLPIGALAITVPTNPVPPPAAEEVQSLISEARARAVGYRDSFPNFICLQLTNRAADSSGGDRWKHLDTIAERLTYRDKAEERKIVAIDGKPSDESRESMEANQKAVFSAGEFGGDLFAVFADSAKADFQWKETDSLGDGKVQVFNYRVLKANSMFSVTGSNNDVIKVGYHGQVYIDNATRSVRRINLVADDIPANFPTHSTAITVDYDYVVINAHDYLMPISASLSVRQGRSEAILNTMEFRNYRKFGSESRILPVPAEESPAPAAKP